MKDASHKAIIFDLDDTLYPCSDKLIPDIVESSAELLIPDNPDKAVASIEKIIERGESVEDAILKTAETHNVERVNMIAAVHVPLFYPLNITCYDGVHDLLTRLKASPIQLFLITAGDVERQDNKIDTLEIRRYFDGIYIVSKGEKKEIIGDILDEQDLHPSQVVVVGDKPLSEIAAGNETGCTTVCLNTGRHLQNGEADYERESISTATNLLLCLTKQLNLVAIGGGTGLPNMLRGMKRFADDLTALVATTDSGRSTGRIRNAFSMPAPGDIRNCLVALSDKESVSQAVSHRFMKGDIQGHTLGNLLITALTQEMNSFQEAIDTVGDILNIDGKVIPSPSEDVHLEAVLEDGTVITSEDNIVARQDRTIKRSPIKKVRLTEEVPINPRAKKALARADVILIGPGQLYTSVISPLLPKGTGKAIRKSQAKTVFVCNIMTVAAQTEGYTVEDHLETVESYIGQGVIDKVIYNTKRPHEKYLEPYHREHAFMVKRKSKQSGTFVGADVLESLDKKRTLWSKQDWLRHDPDKIAEVIADII